MNIKRLSQVTGIPRESLTNVANQRRHVSMRYALKISNALHCQPVQIFSRAVMPKKPNKFTIIGLLEEYGLTTRELSAITGISRTTLIKMEAHEQNHPNHPYLALMWLASRSPLLTRKLVQFNKNNIISRLGTQGYSVIIAKINFTIAVSKRHKD